MKTTTNYKLKKPDGSDVVNIQDFNDNADIIDASLKEITNGLSKVATTGNYNDLSNKPTIPLSYNHPSSHPASMITVSSSNFSGTKLDEVLNELFQNADSGKKSISSVIGSPLSALDTFDNMKTKIQDMKSTLASKLSSKGQSSSSSDSLNNLINKVSNIIIGDYKKGETLALSKFNYNYTKTKLNKYIGQEKKDINNYLYDGSTKFFIEKSGNIILNNWQNIAYYNITTKQIQTIAGKSDYAYDFFYDSKDDMYYFWTNDRNNLYIYKSNIWKKIIECDEVHKNNCYDTPKIKGIDIDGNVITFIYKIYYSASGQIGKKLTICGSNITKNDFDVYLSTYDYILKKPNSTYYYEIRTESKSIAILNSNGEQIKYIDFKDILDGSMIPIKFLDSKHVIYRSYQEILILNMETKEKTGSVRLSGACIYDDNFVIGIDSNEKKIKKYSINNGIFTLVFSIAVPTTEFNISECAANEEILVTNYNKYMGIYYNTKSEISSITLK